MNLISMIKIVDLLKAYQKFIKGKRKKGDVQKFMLNFEEELNALFCEIENGEYKHGGYYHFRIFDPKPREIDKASVRDRIVHQLIYDYLAKIYDKSFYCHSYASRKEKGAHKAVSVFKSVNRKFSHNFRRPIFVLKCDIKKFFASVDKGILFSILKNKVDDQKYLWLIKQTIDSFIPELPRGIPLGNLTSQIFANIYLNELDRFIKHQLKIRYYIRYMDDFIILGREERELHIFSQMIDEFLETNLKVRMHADKVVIREINQGIDFLGYISFPHYCVLRTKTKKRILKRAKKENLTSYFGVLKHCRSHRLKTDLLKQCDIKSN